MRDKSPTNCDAQLPESNFKTRSRAWLRINSHSCVKENLRYCCKNFHNIKVYWKS
ncbi:DUF6783 domain-containing protein [uncultured Robinsoniella sp.]|uniref:DUF6783 domain-containing protein n=1 Tax=uncultured Robinsoniella sp. TaxID=904190 RepID=UPI00374F6431